MATPWKDDMTTFDAEAAKAIAVAAQERQRDAAFRQRLLLVRESAEGGVFEHSFSMPNNATDRAYFARRFTELGFKVEAVEKPALANKLAEQYQVVKW